MVYNLSRVFLHSFTCNLKNLCILQSINIKMVEAVESDGITAFEFYTKFLFS
jgi:hypothetical protein